MHSPTRRIAMGALVGVMSLLLLGCKKTPSAPPGATGGKARVVALSPAVADIMRDLGQSDLLVGRHASDEWSDPSLPPCGDQTNGVDFETLLRVRPTHVFLQMVATPPRLSELGRERGFVVRNFAILTLDEIRVATRELWAWNGAPGEPVPATARAPIEDRMDAAWGRHPGIDGARVGRVLLLAQVDPAGVLGPGSWHHDLLQRLGATPAVTSGNQFITMDAEDILRIAPDAIIIFEPRPPLAAPGPALTTAQLVDRLGVIGTLRIPAVASGRVAVIDNPKCHLPSTAMIGVAEEMAAILERWSR